MSAALRLSLLLGYAVVTFLSFPHPVGGAVLDLGAFVSWVGPGLLILGVSGLRPRRAAAVGFGAGLAAHTAVLHWIYVVTVVYGHAPVVVGLLAPMLLAAYIAAFSAAFAAGLAWLEGRGLASPFSAAAWWTALDHLRSFALTGFPWATLGYAQHANPALAALASYTAVYGLSFVTALGGAALAEGARAVFGASPVARPRRAPGRAAFAAAVCVVLAHAVGLGLRASDPEEAGPALRVAVVQGNIDQGVKWSRSFAARTLEIYEHLSRRAAADGARLIVWPETAVPGALEADADLRERLAGLARETSAALVVGGVGIDRGDGGRPIRFYDSAFVLGADGGLVDRYDKSHLVPFGEYVPFRDLLGLFLRAVARGIAPSDVSAGAGPRATSLPLPDLPPVPAGIAVCYELLFPDLVRGFARDGASLLLAITNDAWYGRTGAPYQFLAITALRSAENRLWTARAANTGVSALIDDRGRVRARTRIFERDLLVGDVPLRPSKAGGSFYARHGDVFAAACWAAVALVALRALARGGVADGTLAERARRGEESTT